MSRRRLIHPSRNKTCVDPNASSLSYSSFFFFLLWASTDHYYDSLHIAHILHHTPSTLTTTITTSTTTNTNKPGVHFRCFTCAPCYYLYRSAPCWTTWSPLPSNTQISPASRSHFSWTWRKHTSAAKEGRASQQMVTQEDEWKGEFVTPRLPPFPVLPLVSKTPSNVTDLPAHPPMQI